MANKKFTKAEAKAIGTKIGINWKTVEFSLWEFWRGLHIELEHGKRDRRTNVTNDNDVMTGKIALAHLYEFPDYYTRLDKLETEAEKYWENKKTVKKENIEICPKCKKPAVESSDYHAALYYVGGSTFKCSKCKYRGPYVTVSLKEYEKLMKKKK